jgi:WD40 repeat protein
MNKENTFFLFVTSAPEDAEHVSHLTDELAAQGFSFWSDQNGNRPDPPYEDEVLQRAIRASSALLLVVSPHAKSARSVKAALSIARMYQRPVYPIWIDGEMWTEALPFGWRGIAGIDARGEQYPDTFQTLVEKLRHLQDSSSAQPEPIPSLMDLSPHPRNPYKGLRFFQSEDAGDFFGREECIDALMNALRETLFATQPAPRFLAVTGPRGSAKSSAIMAGLLPQLQQGRLSQNHKWIYLKRLVQVQHHLEALAFTLFEHFPGRTLTSIREELEDIRGFHRLATTLVERKDIDELKGSHRLAATSREHRDTDELVENPFLHRLAPALLERKDTHVILFVDQFEELFTQTCSEEERQHFLDLLITAMSEPQGPVVVLLALRADFYDRPLRYPTLGQVIEAHHRVILPMTLQELRAAIEKPAQLPDVQLHFEDDLVGDLLFDAHGEEEALPLLQFTLAQLFEKRDGVYLTHQAYQEIGGVCGALEIQAESTYLSLPSQEHQRWAQALFLRLIDAGSVDRHATCRRIPLSELILIDSREMAVLEMVWNTFTEKGLLATSTMIGIPTIEVSHEALIGDWDRLTKWLQEAREDTYVHERIDKDATEWIRRGKPADRLYQGEQLAKAQRWRTRTIPSRDEDAFLQASIQQRQRERHRTMRRAVVVGIAALGITGGTFSLSRLLHPGEATPVQVRLPSQTLPYTYSGHAGAVLSVAWSPDGTRIASASADRTVQVWEVKSGNLLLTYNGHKSFVLSVAWSPDGTRIASASDDKTVQVWEVESGRPLLTYNRHAGSVWSVAWSPDGTRIASASFDKTAQVWEAKSGNLLLTYREHAGTVNSAAWSPDGTRIASASDDRTAQVWEVESGGPLLTYNRHAGTVEDAAWSPDGTRIASASVDRTVQVWEAENGSPLLTYNRHGGTVNSVAWSPEGTRIASASTRTARVWEAGSGNELLIYKGHRGFVVYCVAWSPDGSRIAYASFAQTVQVWSAEMR